VGWIFPTVIITPIRNKTLDTEMMRGIITLDIRKQRGRIHSLDAYNKYNDYDGFKVPNGSFKVLRVQW
jgi:hypothetical protein